MIYNIYSAIFIASIVFNLIGICLITFNERFASIIKRHSKVIIIIIMCFAVFDSGKKLLTYTLYKSEIIQIIETLKNTKRR